VLFAVALLCAGQSSTITGTLAGQVVMQGFLRLAWTPFVVRLVTRALAVVPAVFVFSWFGEDSTVSLLVWTQVVLSIQLPFAMVPLIRFTSSHELMGAYANSKRVWIFASAAAGAILVANGWLIIDVVGGRLPPAFVPVCVCVGAALVMFAGFLAFTPLRYETKHEALHEFVASA
jgi:manganese transport protein